ncbi:hypothetical protein AWC14_23690 [Mycobacterium kyorinense]|uniref:Uncharacterized protein n=1 Tax=Mycobacterium kyorinense TaxID=487514 RepID=A0A1X1YB30_9MYCO|nr:hypothetical protein AWC14_23690 [Mycobacterium kyorinense]
MPADLCADWATPLIEAGFQPSVATTITTLSAPGSRYATAHFVIDEDDTRYRDLKQLVGAEREAVPARGLGPDAAQWLSECGCKPGMNPMLFPGTIMSA